jgi:hypothetical protein
VSLFKYFNETADTDGEQLSWSQHIDAPFRGPVPLLRGSEFDDQLTTVNDFRLREFDLRDSAQADEYRTVMDRIVNGWYQVITCERAKGEDGRVRYVYLEWAERYTVQKPPSAPDRSPPYALTPNQIG